MDVGFHGGGRRLFSVVVPLFGFCGGFCGVLAVGDVPLHGVWCGWFLLVQRVLVVL